MRENKAKGMAGIVIGLVALLALGGVVAVSPVGAEDAAPFEDPLCDIYISPQSESLGGDDGCHEAPDGPGAPGLHTVWAEGHISGWQIVGDPGSAALMVLVFYDKDSTVCWNADPCTVRTDQSCRLELYLFRGQVVTWPSHIRVSGIFVNSESSC